MFEQHESLECDDLHTVELESEAEFMTSSCSPAESAKLYFGHLFLVVMLLNKCQVGML